MAKFPIVTLCYPMHRACLIWQRIYEIIRLGHAAAELVIICEGILPFLVCIDRRERKRLGVAWLERRGIRKRHLAFQVYGAEIESHGDLAQLEIMNYEMRA